MIRIAVIYSCIICLSFQKLISLDSNLETQMTTFNYAKAKSKLVSIGEEHILSHWDTLTEEQQSILLREIQALDLDAFKRQQDALHLHLSSIERTLEAWEPFNNYSHIGSEEHRTLGKQLIAQGKVGCLLVAGGQGSRLSFDAPKGTFQVSVIKKKSLFQIFAEKTIAAGRQAKCLLPLAIMTSPLNHAATLAFFHEHDYFGLCKDQLFFFMQAELPFLDSQGHLLLQPDYTLAKGPDGNGGSLGNFVQSGIWEEWQRQGIEFINYILVDNPLADPFDGELVGFHAAEKNEITVKCVERTNADERVGLLVNAESGISVVEYSEMSAAERAALCSDGTLKHCCTNISLFCFSMNFIKKSVERVKLPWHFAAKPAYFNGPLAWKFETFIFDFLAASHAVKALLYPRSQTFAPLKNGAGSDSLETVQEALVKHDIDTLASICGHPISFCRLELAQQFHYPTAQLLEKWKAQRGPFQGYIEQ